MPSGPKKRKAERRKKEREKKLEKEKEKKKEEEEENEKLNSPTTSSSSQGCLCKYYYYYHYHSFSPNFLRTLLPLLPFFFLPLLSPPPPPPPLSLPFPFLLFFVWFTLLYFLFFTLAKDSNLSKKDVNYNEESSKDDTWSSSSEEDGEKKKGAADGGEDYAVVGEVKVAEEIAIEKRVVAPVGDGAETVVVDEGANKPFDVLIERDDMLSHESAERAVLSDPSDCLADESIQEGEELYCQQSEETEAAPALLLKHRTAWWNCCGMLDVLAGSKDD